MLSAGWCLLWTHLHLLWWATGQNLDITKVNEYWFHGYGWLKLVVQPARQTDNQTVRQADRQWDRQTDRLTGSPADQHPGSQTETWIVEGDQDVGWGFLLCSSLAVYDGEGHPLGLGDVIPHAACGVDDEAQHRRLGEAHQPGPEQSRGARM